MNDVESKASGSKRVGPSDAYWVCTKMGDYWLRSMSGPWKVAKCGLNYERDQVGRTEPEEDVGVRFSSCTENGA
jgi:hypothetical protein